jgi:hypothetical protein
LKAAQWLGWRMLTSHREVRWIRQINMFSINIERNIYLIYIYISIWYIYIYLQFANNIVKWLCRKNTIPQCMQQPSAKSVIIDWKISRI